MPPALLLYLLKSGILESLEPPTPLNGESKELPPRAALARHCVVEIERARTDWEVRGTERRSVREVVDSEAIVRGVCCGQLEMG